MIRRVIPRPSWRRSLLLAAFAAAALARGAQAQGLLTGELIGTVRDSLGRPLPATDVAVTESGPAITRWFVTDPEGVFRIRFLPAGVHSVLVEQLGFRPVVVTGVTLAAGQRRYLDIRLAAQAPPVNQIDTIALVQAEVTTPGMFLELVAPTRSIAERSLGQAYAQPLELEGLPSWLGATATDAFVWGPPRHPGLDNVIVPGWPLDAFAERDGRTSADVAWSAFGGSVTAVEGVRAAHTGIGGYADVGGSTLSAEGTAGGGSVMSLRGGLSAAMMIRPDTARLVAGFDVLNTGQSLAPVLLDDEVGRSVLATAADSFSTSLAAYNTAEPSRTSAFRGFTRLDWMLTGNHTLSVSAFGGRSRIESPDFGAGRAPGTGMTLESFDAAGTLALTSRISDHLGSEFRLAGRTSERDVTGSAVALTVLAGTGQRFGSDAHDVTAARSGLHLSQAVHIQAADHNIKVGLFLDYGSHELESVDLPGGRFAFGDTTAFAAGQGTFERIEGVSTPASFSTTRYGLFLQDRWNVIPGLTLFAGLRSDRARLPENEVQRNSEWLERTGVDNTAYSTKWQQISPRVGLEWDMASDGRLLLSAGAGASLGDIDPAGFAEVMQRTGRQQLVRSVGDVGSWPDAPASATTDRTIMTLAGPQWRGPRLQRGDVSLRFLPSRSVTFEFGGSFRHTEFLLRRHDVNLQPTAGRTDQYGRSVYGSLTNIGGLLVTDSGPGRRIETFDRVSALDADGYSTYWGITAAVSWRAGRTMVLTADYTLSQTRDNWLTGRHGGIDGQLTPFPDSLGGTDWAEGRSDYDLPHRLAIGLAWNAGTERGLSFGVLYRLRSGYPFTAGFRPGIDANGDGSGYNDPAFVDDTLSGVAELVGAWPCLNERQAGFAERNACREPLVHALDLRLALVAGRIGRSRLELYADAVNLLATDLSDADRALYLVDPATAVVDNPAAGTVTVPLVANPNFGERLAGRGGSRLLRIGVRIGS